MRDIREVIQEVRQIAQTTNSFKDRCDRLDTAETAHADELYKLSSAAAEISVSLANSLGYIAQDLNDAAEVALWEELADDEKPEPEPSVKLTRAGFKSDQFG